MIGIMIITGCAGRVGEEEMIMIMILIAVWIAIMTTIMTITGCAGRVRRRREAARASRPSETTSGRRRPRLRGGRSLSLS